MRVIWEGIFSRILGEALAAGGGPRPLASPLLGSLGGGEGGSEALLLAGDMWTPGERWVSPGASSAPSGPRAAPKPAALRLRPAGGCRLRGPFAGPVVLFILLCSVHHLAAVSRASLPRSQAPSPRRVHHFHSRGPCGASTCLSASARYLRW